jgi:hypothetical protein
VSFFRHKEIKKQKEAKVLSKNSSESPEMKYALLQEAKMVWYSPSFHGNFRNIKGNVLTVISG